MKPAIHVKRIYDPPCADDGARILVDRLWPRGVSKQAAALTLWFKDIAPTTELRVWFGHDPENWQEFKNRYRAELQGNRPAVEKLLDFLKEGSVTLLYAAHDPTHNHALVLADYLHHYVQSQPA